MPFHKHWVVLTHCSLAQTITNTRCSQSFVILSLRWVKVFIMLICILNIRQTSKFIHLIIYIVFGLFGYSFYQNLSFIDFFFLEALHLDMFCLLCVANTFSLLFLFAYGIFAYIEAYVFRSAKLSYISLTVYEFIFFKI